MIQPATPRDLPALARMLRDLNALHAAHVPARFHDEGPEAALRAFFEEAQGQGARVLVYRTEGLARGYLMWRPQPEGVPALERSRRMAVLDHLYVEPIWRRRGLAGRLLRRFEAEIAAEGFDGWLSRVHGFNAASGALMSGAGAAVAVQVFEKALPAQTPAASSRPETMPR